MNNRMIAGIAITLLIVLVGFPFCAVASALEATAPGVNVLGLPTPVITGIDAKNSIVQLKADGYLNDNAELFAIVSLVDDSGNVIDTAEKRVNDPDNIRVSLSINKIKVGNTIYVNFTNHGIGSDGVDHTHDVEQPDGKPQTETIIKRVPGRSSVVYVVTEAKPEQIMVEKIVEQEKPIYLENKQKGLQTTSEIPEQITSIDDSDGKENENILNTTATTVLNQSGDIESGNITDSAKITQKIIFLFFLALCAALIALICTLGYFYYFRPRIEEQITKSNRDQEEH